MKKYATALITLNKKKTGRKNNGKSGRIFL